MSADLAAISGDVQQVRSTVASLRSLIRSTDDLTTVTETRERLRLAREWARIHGMLGEVHKDLLRLEIECLRRVAELDGIEALPSNSRNAARYFGKCSDTDVASLVDRYWRSSTAIGIYQAVQANLRDERERASGRDFAAGRNSRNDARGPDRTTMHAFHQTTVTAALETLLEEFSSQSFSISQLADEVLSTSGLASHGNDESLRKGVSEVCREAVRRAPAIFVGDLRAPRFVTCLRDDSSTVRYLRVPFENATLSQLGEMVDLRRAQLEQDQAALAHLERLEARLMSHGSNDEPLGVIADRIPDADEQSDAA